MNARPVFEIHNWDLSAGTTGNRILFRPHSDDDEQEARAPEYTITPGQAKLLMRDLAEVLDQVAW
ncbi:MAG: hypothetical protein QNJ40_16735 [Xanthomonadales bacterium]|nr:hypothetical protein [Xanthomonadales bacterium]